MQVIVSSRRLEANDGLRKLVQERFQRLNRFEPRISRAEVTLLEEKHRVVVEATLSVDRSGLVHAHSEAEDLRTAVDRAVEKAARQLRKVHSRRRDHQAVPREELILGEEGEPKP